MISKQNNYKSAKALTALIGAVLALALAATPAAASVGIESFNTTSSTSQAGGHPDLQTTFGLSESGVKETPKNVTFNAPQGIFGNINALIQCAPTDFAFDRCPPNSQAGLITVYDREGGEEKHLLGTAPIFDVVPQEDQTALFAFVVPTLNIPISIPITVRTGGDYGLRFTVSDITQLTPLTSATLTFWGFPAAGAHSAERFPVGSPGSPSGCPGLTNASCNPEPTLASIPDDPLTDNPTACSGETLVTELRVETYQDPGSETVEHASYPAITGCDKETFKPLLQAQPTTHETDAPSGLDVNLSAKIFEGHATSPSEIKSAVVTLPPGLTINPDAADGQQACKDSEANFHTEGPAECPDNAKIGTISVGSPTLNGRLTGSLYFGEPQPGDQYRLFMVFDGFGMHAKLVGSAVPDPETGQVKVYFNDLPQVPFEDFDIHLFASDRGLMATPTTCQIYPVEGRFFPWNETLPDQNSVQFFTLTEGPHGSSCPGEVRPFHPTLTAGTSNPLAGAYSDFTLKLNREDGDQYLGKLNFVMPPGLTANLHGVTYCPDQDIAEAAQMLGRLELAQPSCPVSSEIGTSNVAAGPGSHPFHAVGKVYLAGPFEGAPLSLAVITPALAGPYDYGTVVVRVAIHVDPTDAHVIADSETVPEIIGGVPIRMREIRVGIDRPNFIINPTNCSEFQTISEGVGDQGTPVAFSSPFVAVNCSALPFKPRMKITQLGGHKATFRAQAPSIRFDLNTREGDANIRSIAVTLPNALEIDQNHLGNLCSKAELEATHCAGRQPIGTVSDETPLLEKPLEGLAYAVSGYKGLPHVAFILDGQVMVVPQAESKTIRSGGLRTTVPVVPDVPVGHFRLTLYGGKRGYLANTRSLCTHRTQTTIEYTAQNGRALSQKIPITAACGSSSKRHKRHRR